MPEIKDGIKPSKQLQSAANRCDAPGQFHDSLECLPEKTAFYRADAESDMFKKTEWKTSYPRKYTPDPKKWIERPNKGRPMLLLADPRCAFDEVEYFAWSDHIIPEPEKVHDEVEIASTPTNRRVQPFVCKSAKHQQTGNLADGA